MCASWILGSWLLEYIYDLLSLGPFMFGMPDITTSTLSPVLGPSAHPSVGLGAPHPFTRLIDLGVVIFHPLLHLWRIFTTFT